MTEVQPRGLVQDDATLQGAATNGAGRFSRDVTGERIELMGMPIDRVTEPEAIGSIMSALESRRGGFVITPHLEMLRRYWCEPNVRSHFEEADLIVADGEPLVWASRIQGTPLPERIAGSDLVWSLCAECALHEKSIYLLGAAPGACEDAEAKLREHYPGLRIAGCYSPPMGFESKFGEVDEIRTRLAVAQPDVVFVALGFPKQERLIRVMRDVLPNAWFLGCGVSLSFIAGHVARAPDWAIRLGLEWLHRLFQEPRRLFKRYVVHGMPFAARLFTHSAWKRVRRRARVLPAKRPPMNGNGRVVFHHGHLERQRVRDLEQALQDVGPPQS